MSHLLSLTADLLPKELRSEHGGDKLVPGAI